MRARTRFLVALLIVIAAGGVVLTCYALFIKAQAESLLRDLTALIVGISTDSDVKGLTRRHEACLVSQENGPDSATTTFTVRNRLLSALKVEPDAWFSGSVTVRRGYVYHISARLMRSMDIYPTFQASAGMVDEYAEYPAYLSDTGHFEFPTPVGKPYLKILLDSHASLIQRQHAFDFSFTCLVKPGGGCDLPCDYLPSAWQDWRTYLQHSDLWGVFNQKYPNSSRCRQ